MKRLSTIFALLVVAAGTAFGQFYTTVLRDDEYNIIDWDILAASNAVAVVSNVAVLAEYNVFTTSNLFSQLSITNATVFGSLVMSSDEAGELVFGGGIRMQASPEGIYVFYNETPGGPDISVMQISTNAGSTALQGNWLYTGSSSSGLQIMTYQAGTDLWAEVAGYNVFASSNKFNGAIGLGSYMWSGNGLITRDADGVYSAIAWDSSGTRLFSPNGYISIDLQDTYGELGGTRKWISGHNATNGTEIVNYQTMTNWVISGVQHTVTGIDDTDSPYNATFGEFVVADASSNPITVNLPNITAADVGKEISVHKTDAANNVTLSGNGGDAINGSAVISSQYDTRTVVAISTTAWAVK